MSITQEEIKELFKYNNGKIYWKKVNAMAKNINNGDRAGSKHNTGYRNVKVNNKTYREHRIIFLYHYGYLPKEIDHINNVKDDNRIENLREVTRSQNCMNSSKSKNKSSKFKGVDWLKRNNKWRARIRLDENIQYLGSFNYEIDAAIAYNKAAEKLHGEYANLNEV